MIEFGKCCVRGSCHSRRRRPCFGSRVRDGSELERERRLHISVLQRARPPSLVSVQTGSGHKNPKMKTPNEDGENSSTCQRRRRRQMIQPSVASRRSQRPPGGQMSSAALGELDGSGGSEPISRLARLGGLFLDHLSLHRACPSRRRCPRGRAARVWTSPRCPADGVHQACRR